MMSVGKCAPRPLLLPKYPSNQAIGSMQISVTTPTMPIGMSRSVIGRVSARPAFRARDAAIALASPLATGFTNLSNVQIAETPIAPAPTKRTFVLQVFCASVAARSEEHTSELQSRRDLVCRLLLEKKKTHARTAA